MKGYKAFNPGWICRGFKYEIGKTYELPDGQKLEMCKCGFHFCKNPIDVFGYYTFNDDVLIAEVEAIGKIKQEGTKYVTDKIKIVKELTMDHLQTLIIDKNNNTGIHNSGNFNSGKFNSGSYNSGDSNSGNYNSGNYNAGSFNSGIHNSGNFNSGNYNAGSFNSGNFNSENCNSGSYNSGYCNSGDYNTGSYNSGIRNSGNHNSGIRNSGNFNSGNYNTGNFNSGHYNSGYYNSGDFNSGDFNLGNFNSGIFNTDEPFMRMFNKPTNIRMSDFIHSIDYEWFDLRYRIHKNELLPEDYSRIKALPNFDANIFEMCTGIKIEKEN